MRVDVCELDGTGWLAPPKGISVWASHPVPVHKRHENTSIYFQLFLSTLKINLDI